jgi:hypothetical protein
MNMEGKTVYFKETVECQHLIFEPLNKRNVHCHTAKLEPNLRVSVRHLTQGRT